MDMQLWRVGFENFQVNCGQWPAMIENVNRRLPRASQVKTIMAHEKKSPNERWQILW